MLTAQPVENRVRVPVSLSEGAKGLIAIVLAAGGSIATWMNSVDLGKVTAAITTTAAGLSGTAWGIWLVMDRIRRSKAATDLEIMKNNAQTQLELELKRDAALAPGVLPKLREMQEDLAKTKELLAKTDHEKADTQHRLNEMMERLLALREKDHDELRTIGQSTKKIESSVSKTKQVLVVEDDDATVDALIRLLEFEGFIVEAATSLDEAKLKVSKDTHAVILDLGLPDGSGWGLLRAIRQLGFDGILIIVYTGQSRDSPEFKAHEDDLKPDYVMTKPPDIVQLIAYVKSSKQSQLPAP